MALADDLEYTLNGEYARRLLIRYFSEKGFAEDFDKKVYPPLLQDMIDEIPALEGKVELVPYVAELDPNGTWARLGWNIFILGNQRMHLGETEHANLQELARQMDSGNYVVSEGSSARRMRSARDIVEWVTRVLQSSKAGLIRTTDDPADGAFGRKGPFMVDNKSGSMWERPKTIRPEGSSQF